MTKFNFEKLDTIKSNHPSWMTVIHNGMKMDTRDGLNLVDEEECDHYSRQRQPSDKQTFYFCLNLFAY